MVDHSNSPISFIFVVVLLTALLLVLLAIVSFAPRTITTMAKLISFRIIKETKNPDHDKKYNTSLAGIRSEIIANGQSKFIQYFTDC